MAVLLTDGPGQGETRLFHGLTWAGVEEAFATMIRPSAGRPRLTPSIGDLGQQHGRLLAALSAATDRRITACVVNGGTVRPVETAERYRRFITKVQLLLGIDDPDKARQVMDSFVLDPDLLASMRCPLLVLHGTPDQVFLIDNARALYDQAGSADKTFHEFPGGDHCIYNHSHEKHTIIGDWLADRLISREER